MALPRSVIERLIFGTQQMRRFTQDSPVMPDVWLAYNESPGEAVDLLLTPYKDCQPAALYVALRARLRADSRRAGDTTPRGLTYNESYVVARMTLAELIRCALPLTRWWASYVWPEARKAVGKASPGEAPADALKARIESLRDPDVRRHLVQLIERRRSAVAGPVKEERPASGFSPSSDLLWMLEIAGSIAAHGESQDAGMPPLEEAVRKVQEMIAGIDLDDLAQQPLLWAVNLNRPVTQAVWKSSLAVKADAARRLFDISCRGLRWAVIDSGVDATHPAFRRRVGDNPHAEQHKKWLGAKGENRTRIVECYDFTRLRALLDPETPEPENAAGKVLTFTADDRRRMKDLRASIEQGGMLDWERLSSLVRVPLDKRYPKPVNVHGTHVAGILAGDWRIADGIPEDYDLQGMCPDLELIDVRVLDAGGQSDEFTVLAALQFIRYLNANKARPAVHGVNLSLSLYHSVMNYACGQTPVCEECQRLVNTGTVVVAAAGNEGHAAFLTSQGSSEGYRNISITDPGNAEAVITVGATHRNRAFTYGVSYFSSRGPTGDGRSKPDLVAPGEKISSAIPGDDLDSLDGTSMAAPHVSGAAALLMARHDELIGDPLRIKKILCQTATDLGRERFFQGAGMLDVLRALQSV